MEVIIIPINYDIEIEEFKPWLERKTVKILQPLDEQGKKLVDKIKEKISDARETFEKLAEEGTRELERGKAVRKARVTEKLSKHFLKQIDKIAFPNKVSFSELDKLHKDLEKMFSSLARERNAWFPRISPLFIIARKRVDFAFGRLTSSISELGSLLSSDYSKARTVEKLFFEADEMMGLLDKVGEYDGRKTSIKEKMHLLQKKIEESEQRIESIRGNTELSDLAEMNQRIQQLRKQVKHVLRHLQKPFRKFVNLTKGSGYTLLSEEVEKLDQYLEDPFVAFATEKSGYPMLRGILGKMERAMREGKLRLKSSRLRKAREEIDVILNKNDLNELHIECVRAFSLSRQLVSSEEAQMAQEELNQLQRRVAELRKRRKAVGIRFDVLEREHKQLLERVEEQKVLLEETVFEVLGVRVCVRI